jgi:hypothetical protein
MLRPIAEQGCAYDIESSVTQRAGCPADAKCVDARIAGC